SGPRLSLLSVRAPECASVTRDRSVLRAAVGNQGCGLIGVTAGRGAAERGSNLLADDAPKGRLERLAGDVVAQGEIDGPLVTAAGRLHLVPEPGKEVAVEIDRDAGLELSGGWANRLPGWPRSSARL